MGLPKKIPQSASKSKSKDEVPDDQKKVILNRYRVEKKLGSGNFGTAYLVTDLKTGNIDDKLKVLKQIPCGALQPDETVDAMHEAKLLSKLNHEGIVKFYDSFIDGEFFCIVTEYCEGGDLDEYITRMKKRGQKIPENQVMDWAVQLLMAVHYMHCRRVLHRDLKARNIFLRNNAIKIGDFGISRILMGTADMASTFVGTPYYMSPEVLKHEGYNSKSDVWSIGCIIFELCCQRHAFEGQGLMGVMFKIVEGDCPKIEDFYSKKLQDLIATIFTKDPEKRPAASELLKLPFILRHAEKMQMKEDSDYLLAEQDAQAIELTLQKKYHRKDLEEEKYKHMTPRERLRLKKQEEADRRAMELAAASKMNLQTNLHRKQHISELKRQQDPAPWTDASRKEKTFVLPEDGPTIRNARPYTSYVREVEVETDEEDEDHMSATVIHNKTVSSIPHNQGANTTYTLKPKQSSLAKSLNLDDRPITPMKNRMVYDVRHSTLDFKDGIPDDPKLAETYYSQFEDEFVNEKEVSPTSIKVYGAGGDAGNNRVSDESDNGEVESDESQSGSEDEEDEEEKTLVGATSDEAALIKQMEQQLSTATRVDKDYNEDTIALADDAYTGAFGPGARNMKIVNLRKKCEKNLGTDAFKKVYSFLKAKRYEEDGESSVDEGEIRQGLRQITTRDNDCFDVDQLLFLEFQAKMFQKS